MPKRKQNTVLLLLLIMILLMGCSSASTQEPTPPSYTHTKEPTETPTEAPSSTPIPTPTTTPTPVPLNGQQTQYFIDLTVNYYNRYISATSRAIYTNKTQSPIDEIVFVIYPTIFQSAVYIKSIKLGDGSSITDFRWESHRMLIPLETPLEPGEQIEFIHDFELYMPDRDGTFGQTGRQLNLSHWFPFIPPYDEDEGWLVYEVSLINSQFVGEHLMYESADFDVTLAFTDRRENMKIAAGALPEETDGVLHYYLPLSRTFTLSISDIYTIAEKDVNGIKIFCYTFPEEANVGEAAVEIAADAVELFSDLYGPMEHDLISIVEAEFPHNMEFDGLIFVNQGMFMFYDGTPKINLTIITPHEVSHQWFFRLVGNNQALEPWLDEALATYSEALFYEQYYPDLVPWWWENRVDGYHPSGFVDNTIYLEDGYVAYRNSVYFNGAHFLQDLRDTVGDEAFFSFLKNYVQKYRYTIVSGDDFWNTLREHTDADLSNIIEQYFSKPVNLP